MTIAVIGSGLAALAATHALIARGVRPVVIDAASTLSGGAAALAARLGAVSPDAWDAGDVARARQNPSVTGGGVPKKLVFGSDYFYNAHHPDLPITGETAACPTLAKGGYSVAWGGAVLPPPEEDLENWPLTPADMAAACRRVFRWLPLSAAQDSLGDAFPLHHSAPGQIPSPPQAKAFLEDAQSVIRPDLLIGRARLAVSAKACRSCGLCLSGCPYGAIFNAADAFAALAASGAVAYWPHRIVQALEEHDESVVVRWARSDGGGRESASFRRVFLAAGAINSTHILMRSLGLFDRSAVFSDSQKFIAPLLRRRAAPLRLDSDPGLAALFIETRSAQQQNRWMHVQVSATNDLIAQKLGLDRGGLRGRLARPVATRLMVLWCSLHSAVSGQLIARLQPGDGDRTVLHLEESGAARAMTAARKAARELARKLRPGGNLLLPLGLVFSRIGSGNHIGGTFPHTPDGRGIFSSDAIGRPAGLRRVHVIDSTIFPTIPATTIALPIMATADHIARSADLAQ